MEHIGIDLGSKESQICVRNAAGGAAVGTHSECDRARVKAMRVSREALIKARTQLIGRVRSYVRGRLGRVLRATPESLPKPVRAALLDDPAGLPLHVERTLIVLETISTQVADADDELRLLAQADARMSRLMSVPGVGPVTAARFVAAVDDVTRFPTAASLASYLGLVPGENTTGFRTKRTKLTRTGAPQVRCALGQAAWSIYVRRKQDPMAVLGQADRSPARTAGGHHGACTKARHVLYAMWKHETSYDPTRAARAAIA